MTSAACAFQIVHISPEVLQAMCTCWSCKLVRASRVVCVWPIWSLPVADMVCGRYRRPPVFRFRIGLGLGLGSVSGLELAVCFDLGLRLEPARLKALNVGSRQPILYTRRTV